jgi:hypothetical protein
MPVPHVSTEHYGVEYQEFLSSLFRDQVVRDIDLAKKTEYKR